MTESAGEYTSAIKPDWERIEVDYRSGMKTLRVIASEHGISHVAINKRAKRDGWGRDLATRIAERAAAKVAKAAVTSLVTKKTEQAVVEANATLQADIVLSHIKDVARKRALVTKLFAEIEGITDSADLIEQLTLELRQRDQSALATIVEKTTSLPQLIKSTTELVRAYKALIGLEREVYGIKDDASPSENFSEIVRRIVTT